MILTKSEGKYHEGAVTSKHTTYPLSHAGELDMFIKEWQDPTKQDPVLSSLMCSFTFHTLASSTF